MPKTQLQIPAAAPLHDEATILPEIIAPVPVEANDNEAVAAPRQPESRTFELPAAIWGATVACYGVFLLALLGATGGARVALAITVAVVYVAMFFGTARVMLRQGPAQPRSPLDRSGGVIQTLYGPVSRADAYGQVLLVPVTVALFAIAVSVISATVM